MDKKALLGRRIGYLRKRRRGLSQEELAERAGISPQYVSNIERGNENPTLDILFKLADALKVSFGELCDFDVIDDMDEKKLRSAIRDLVAIKDAVQLKSALRVLKAVLR